MKVTIQTAQITFQFENSSDSFCGSKDLVDNLKELINHVASKTIDIRNDTSNNPQ